MTLPLPDLTVSVIIPVHNGGDKFRRCLSSVDVLRPPPAEVIVVADGDQDGSRKLAEEFDIRVIKRPVPGGPAAARNSGARQAKGDILFFIDADVAVPAGIIEQIRSPFQNDPELDALIGSYDDEPFESNFLSQYKNLLHHYVHQNSKEDASTFWGACGAIRREVFFNMNGFNAAYSRPSVEDIDLGYRLKKSGYKINLLKHIQVKHLKHWEISSLLKTDIFDRALPWTELILREGQLIDDLNLKLTSRVSVMTVYMLSFFLIGSVLVPWLLIPAFFLMALLAGLNWDLYRFYKGKRGLGFAVKAVPWHWLYFFYSGLAFAVGYVKNQVERSKLKTHPRKKAE